MNKRDFYNQFRALLPDTLSQTTIDLDNIETSVLFFVGHIISNMTEEAQEFYDLHENDESAICNSFQEFIIGLATMKYHIEW